MGQMDAATAERVAQLPAALKGEGADLGDIPACSWTVEGSDGMFRVNSSGLRSPARLLRRRAGICRGTPERRLRLKYAM
ncbi:hypothetical protein [Alsobacter metallidurans]|nr:hypothetical protein [Alsobacter metallidurans]